MMKFLILETVALPQKFRTYASMLGFHLGVLFLNFRTDGGSCFFFSCSQSQFSLFLLMRGWLPGRKAVIFLGPFRPKMLVSYSMVMTCSVLSGSMVNSANFLQGQFQRQQLNSVPKKLEMSLATTIYPLLEGVELVSCSYFETKRYPSSALMTVIMCRRVAEWQTWYLVLEVERQRLMTHCRGWGAGMGSRQYFYLPRERRVERRSFDGWEWGWDPQGEKDSMDYLEIGSYYQSTPSSSYPESVSKSRMRLLLFAVFFVGSLKDRGCQFAVVFSRAETSSFWAQVSSYSCESSSSEKSSRKLFFLGIQTKGVSSFPWVLFVAGGQIVCSFSYLVQTFPSPSTISAPSSSSDENFMMTLFLFPAYNFCSSSWNSFFSSSC